MTNCLDEGTLRAHLDGELPERERAAADDHLATCAACRAARGELRRSAAQAALLLAAPPPPDPRGALARLAADRPAPPHPAAGAPRRRPPMTRPGLRRWAAPAAALALALALLALPPVRAAADQLLQVFRVQTVVFVPVSKDRIEQLQKLDVDGKSLFVAEPKVTNNPAEPRTVASADEASAAVGFTVEQPSALPGAATSTTIKVTDRTVGEFQVNVETARQVLKLSGVDDVTLPDSLGASPISVDMPPAAVTEYTGEGYSLRLFQGRSPQVNLPDGVDLSQLGRAALRILGMSPEQADALASKVDWSSTLIFPFPADLNTVRQVSVGGAPGLLVTGDRGGEAQLYWQRGDRFYVMQLDGARGEELLTSIVQAAESVR